MLLSLTLCLAYVGLTSCQSTLTPPYTCTSTTTQCHPGVNTENPPSFPVNNGANAVHQGRPGKRGETGERGEKGDKGDPCQCDVADEEAMGEMRKRMEKLEEENLSLKEILSNIQGVLTPTNCTDAAKYYKREDLTWVQIYPLKEIGDLTPYTVRCPWDGWIVIQRRNRGSVDFYRDWESYAKGFGDKNDEFWLGLRAIHFLTSARNYKLRIDLKLTDGSVKFADYSTFRVANEEDGFRLTISGYSGDATDRMVQHNNHRFTTKDRDFDDSGSNCAVSHKGAWWYYNCYASNLNGKYGLRFHWRFPVSFSEMRISPT